MAKEISSPEFLPFLMQYQNSILIIEDAENIIKDRNETLVPSQAVANLLNLYVDDPFPTLKIILTFPRF